MSAVPVDPAALTALASEIAIEAGEVLLGHYERLRPEQIDRKGRIDMVTVADHESEALILERLGAALPDHFIVAEDREGRRVRFVFEGRMPEARREE